MKCTACGTDLPDDAAFCSTCGKATGITGDVDQMLTIGGLQTEFAHDTEGRKAVRQAELEPGSVFADRFTIQSLIGRGGMGVVYAAKDRVTEQDIALKLIRRDRLSGPEAVRKLVREGVTTRDIRHPNIVSVYDVGETDGQPYMSMELLAGQSLRQWIRDRARAREDVPFPVAEQIVREILAGLKAAHDKGVIHRDLKPENVMLLHRPEAEAAPLRVADFGIAQAAGTNVETGGTGAVGTVKYMAPEQITAPDTVTEAADLYSLSIIFYELLVGVLPQGHWQPPSGGREDVPEYIDKLIERGLSNRPMSRPQTVDAYLEAMTAPEPKPKKEEKRRPAPPPPPPPTDVPAWKDAFKSTAFKVVAGLVIAAALLGVMINESGVFDTTYIPEPVYTPPAPTPVVRPTPTPTPTPTPVTPSVNPYAYLNGIWYQELPGGLVDWRVRVSSNGQMTGSGFVPGTGNVSLNGAFNGAIVRYTATVAGQNFTYVGTFDGGCHINVPGVAYLHVNHYPGEDCP